jgi:predicted HAD superfamily Cof-like phosphohydrolase
MDASAAGQGNQPASIAAAVAEFHAVFGLPVRRLPAAGIDPALARLRISLLEEETGEFRAAAENRDLIEIADALADVVWVAYGTALTYGIDLDSVLREVHRSNMSKLDADGRPLLRDDGKVLKSERFFPPDIRAVLDAQQPLRLHGGGDQGG